MTFEQAKSIADALYLYEVSESMVIKTRLQLPADVPPSEEQQQALVDAVNGYIGRINNLMNATNTLGLL